MLRNRRVYALVLALILIVLELLPNKDVNYHGLRLYVTLGYTWFQPRPLNVP